MGVSGNIKEPIDRIASYDAAHRRSWWTDREALGVNNKSKSIVIRGHIEPRVLSCGAFEEENEHERKQYKQ